MNIKTASIPLRNINGTGVIKVITKWIKKPLTVVDLTVGEVINIWLYDLLIGSKLFSEVQITVIMNYISENLIKYIDENFNPDANINTLISFIVLDRRYLVINSQDKIFDCKELEELDCTPVAFLEAINYNLIRLYFMNMERIKGVEDEHRNGGAGEVEAVSNR